MTTLTLRKHNKDELQFLIDCEMQAYAIAVQGREAFYVQGGRPEMGPYNKYGAIVQIAESTALGALQVLQERIDAGASICTTKAPTVEVTTNYFYYVKSPAEQTEDAKGIAAEVAKRYEAEIEAHNDKVYLQELKALQEEEARVAAELKAEDAAREAADLDRRVRERMRGSKGAK
ncbi:hypothetical protein [Pseudomonas sp. GD03696]|uniref:hypothetical protein n=1 Tax=Pseudomonas sp. GD03696 TaxID=2975368 RepID=UPI002446D84E|nr:hypothetical protein [Pseudomonas sp. GD03696]MDH1927781.1 hypothetical protein [Pseudomonas sp. GD03696]